MEQQDRLHSLDAVRAFALLLGIAFHATLSFIPTAATMGPIVDNSPSKALAATSYVLHIFRMTTFFVVAGFFARLVVHRKGVKAFVRNRFKRIFIPLVISWPILIVMVTGVVYWAFVKFDKPMTAPARMESVLLPFPWIHLWFLYVLLIMYVVVIGARWLAINVVDRNSHAAHTLDKLLASTTLAPVAPILLAIPSALSLFAADAWNFKNGIPTPDVSLIPNLAAFVSYGTAIVFGWFLHRQAQLLQTFERYWLRNFLAAVALTAVCYQTVRLNPSITQLDAVQRGFYAAAYSIAVWCWTFAIIGAASKFLSSVSPVRRYLADASYWMYLLHLPLVFALQTLVAQWSVHWSIKYLFILAVAFSLLLLSYHFLVRSTYIGEILNGRRYPRGEKPRAIDNASANDSAAVTFGATLKSGDAAAMPDSSEG